MKVVLPTIKDVVVVQEVKKSISEVNILQMQDNPESKIMSVHTLELGTIVLWEGAAYDTIGQWTDTDVINKIIEIVNS